LLLFEVEELVGDAVGLQQVVGGKQGVGKGSAVQHVLLAALVLAVHAGGGEKKRNRQQPICKYSY